MPEPDSALRLQFNGTGEAAAAAAEGSAMEAVLAAAGAAPSLEQLLKLPGNKRCFDCGGTPARWASLNLGVFMCDQCAGFHRQLGTHISKVRSVTLDHWTDEQVCRRGRGTGGGGCVGGMCAREARGTCPGGHPRSLRFFSCGNGDAPGAVGDPGGGHWPTAVGPPPKNWRVAAAAWALF